MPIEFIDPRAEPGAPPEAYELSLAADVSRPVFGFLANGFLDSVNLARHLEEAMRRLVPGSGGLQLAKSSVAVVVGGDLLDHLIGGSDAVIGLYGH